jgi:hypothetical protein
MHRSFLNILHASLRHPVRGLRCILGLATRRRLLDDLILLLCAFLLLHGVLWWTLCVVLCLLLVELQLVFLEVFEDFELFEGRKGLVGRIR